MMHENLASSCMDYHFTRTVLGDLKCVIFVFDPAYAPEILDGICDAPRLPGQFRKVGLFPPHYVSVAVKEPDR